MQQLLLLLLLLVMVLLVVVMMVLVLVDDDDDGGACCDDYLLFWWWVSDRWACGCPCSARSVKRDEMRWDSVLRAHGRGHRCFNTHPFSSLSLLYTLTSLSVQHAYIKCPSPCPVWMCHRVLISLYTHQCGWGEWWNILSIDEVKVRSVHKLNVRRLRWDTPASCSTLDHCCRVIHHQYISIHINSSSSSLVALVGGGQWESEITDDRCFSYLKGQPAELLSLYFLFIQLFFSLSLLSFTFSNKF